MKRAAAGVALLALLAGCVLAQRSDAALFVMRAHPGGPPFPQIVITKVQPGLRFNWHGGLHHPQDNWSLALPRMPVSRTVYEAADVRLYESGRPTGTFSGGTVTLDLTAERVSVSLERDGEAFPGNGVYRLSLIDGR